MKILFVCNCNLNRSPTFEKWFKSNTNHEVKSAGIYYGYPNKLSKELLDWADKVYLMDLTQQKYMDEHHLYHHDVEIIGISDEYDPDDPELIELIEYFWKEEREKYETVGKALGTEVQERDMISPNPLNTALCRGLKQRLYKGLRDFEWGESGG